MVYHILPEEILLIAQNYSVSFRTRKNTEQLVKYPRVLYFKTSKNVNVCIWWDLVQFAFIYLYLYIASSAALVDTWGHE